MDYLPTNDVEISTKDGKIFGILHLDLSAKGLVIVAHGSASSRHSPQNSFLAKVFKEHKLSSIFLDLLTPNEAIQDELTSSYRFNIELLSQRLILASKWALENYPLKIGYFADNTAAAAALSAAVEMKDKIFIVVSKGGRADLAFGLDKLTTPTLFIVGGNDRAVLEINKTAYKKIKAPKFMKIISGAGHLFEEPKKLEESSILAAKTFLKFFKKCSSKEVVS
jgi:putative phosphoribosyl transferase